MPMIFRGISQVVLFAAIPLLFLAEFASGQNVRRPNPAFAPVTDKPHLPRVLLIGDSISIGYTLPVREQLQERANVHRPRANCQSTKQGLEKIDEWLGDGEWDVIHFNWGLHDLKYLGANGKNLADPRDPNSHQQVPVEQYERNLDALVKRMAKTGAKLIWCSTTPVPEGAQGRVPGDAEKYNAAARRVMEQHAVAINDLHAFCAPRLKEIQRPANVHFTDEGSRKLAIEVASAIEKALPSP